MPTENPKPDLSIIILNYNAAPFLPQLFDSIKKQRGLVLQTIMVDNKSTDNSVALVKRDYPWVEIVQRQTSKGFSAGNNAGLPLAKADTILFLNPDMRLPDPLALKKCYDKYYSDPQMGILTCRVNLVVNGQIDETCHRGFPTPWAALTYFSGLARLFPKSKLFAQYLQTYKGYDTGHEVDSVGGMFMMLSRRVGEEVGWWDEDYPLYGEDIDFCYRVKTKGYKIYYWPKVEVEHYKGASTGRSKHSKKVTTANKETVRRVKGWSVQAMEIFYRKHYLDKYPWFINHLVFLGLRLMRFRRVTLA